MALDARIPAGMTALLKSDKVELMAGLFKSVSIEPLRTMARSDSMATVWPLPVIISPPNEIQKGRSHADQ
ncbi:hypothetical protein [Methylomonas fluvii]|uniref:Uncharacterized protein n=1 Tax=Methylomonas fluvii TaxID=1854564 RepID=A0ABR9DFD5_9GAMM|nr:hypothetical protein [Methylomonas fluvii]MBD9361787.1 hypothetical protein [Methylomonas fluvii]